MCSGASEYESIRNAVKASSKNEQIADILCSLFRYMQQKRWIGACHATKAVIYIALKECDSF